MIEWAWEDEQLLAMQYRFLEVYQVANDGKQDGSKDDKDEHRYSLLVAATQAVICDEIEVKVVLAGSPTTSFIPRNVMSGS